VDVWEVDVHGLAVEPAPDGWLLCRMPIPPASIRLIHRDRPPDSRPLCSVALSFVSERLAVDEMSRLAGMAPDRADVDDGGEFGLEPGRRCSYWVIEGGDRYAPLDTQAGELLERIAAAEPGLTRLSAASLLGRIGVTVRISVG
jgi:hypothetical protein